MLNEQGIPTVVLFTQASKGPSLGSERLIKVNIRSIFQFKMIFGF